MHSVIAKLRGSAQDGIENTQVEFGKLLSFSPLSYKQLFLFGGVALAHGY
ncbi:hypothetical protein ACFU8X_28570 [Brevibacillus porteri]